MGKKNLGSQFFLNFFCNMNQVMMQKFLSWKRRLGFYYVTNGTDSAKRQF